MPKTTTLYHWGKLKLAEDGQQITLVDNFREYRGRRCTGSIAFMLPATRATAGHSVYVAHRISFRDSPRRAR